MYRDYNMCCTCHGGVVLQSEFAVHLPQEKQSMQECARNVKLEVQIVAGAVSDPIRLQPKGS